MKAAGRSHLAERVIHTSAIEDDGADYDIQAFKTDGTDLYIKLKSTNGGISFEFFIISNLKVA